MITATMDIFIFKMTDFFLIIETKPLEIILLCIKAETLRFQGGNGKLSNLACKVIDWRKRK